MAKIVKLQGTLVVFPKACVVCEQYAMQNYEVSRTFTYGNRTITIALPVPMCAEHYTQAKAKSPTEKLVGIIGLIVGAVVGLTALVALMIYWMQTGQGNFFLNLLIGTVVGAGFFLIIWVIVNFWIAPIFAFPASKVARKGVSLKKFDPRRNILEIKFENDRVADSFRRENSSTVVA